MKVVSWNVNGLRAVIKKGNLIDFIEKSNIDVLLLQETKLSTNADVNPAVFKGYKFYNFFAQKKGYSGTGIIIKDTIKHEVKYGMGIKEFDIEGRVINLFIDDLVIISTYFPNSQLYRRRIDYKLAFCGAMKEYLTNLSKQSYKILISGDYNVAHTEIDLARPKGNEESPGFLPEERECLTSFLKRGLIDTFRYKYPDKKDAYTWWSYRAGSRPRNV